MDPLAVTDLNKELRSLKTSFLYRSLLVTDKKFVNFSSNDYLGLSQHPAVIQAAQKAVKTWGAGSGASRLLSGNLGIHGALEERLARFKSEEACRIFSSGYLANLGAVTALVGEKDLVISDRLNHASLIDAARLSRAKLWIYPHLDITALQKLLKRSTSYRRRLVMTESYFGMDGHMAPLDRIAALCHEHRAALLVDEAHATGVFGEGHGLTRHFKIEGQADIVMGTLSKALGTVGGFLTGKKILTELFTNRSKSFIYSTAPAPAASAAALASLEAIEKTPELLKKLWSNVRKVREGLLETGWDLMGSEGPVVPVRIGDPRKATAFQAALEKEGLLAPAIRQPTVPRGTDRIRLSVSAIHSPADIDRLVKAFRRGRVPS